MKRNKNFNFLSKFIYYSISPVSYFFQDFNEVKLST